MTADHSQSANQRLVERLPVVRTTTEAAWIARKEAASFVVAGGGDFDGFVVSGATLRHEQGNHADSHT